ncbi:MAG: hypothetical protein F4W68_07500 [Cenarchaeum sp. SB0661_bin_35]|nr:hypothetical protein [Cenarchaeum sp. SB0667_bin_13]MYC80321.1 hypothetical protein [Cenarchaeum sp. SB0661_bin_35]MYG32777.1 hypothetical protein [Cenarchaeum sp. SB0677_bin_16]MYI51252.1 hypothetical protein [Cenarchaeum sp. SB0673_bin_9]
MDSYDKYRLEIGWENTPPYSGEVNAIRIYVSPLVEGLELEEQPFINGVTGLEDTLKMEVLNRHSSITLLLTPSDIDGLYRTFVKIDRAGFYQVNLFGNIEGTPISLSMHPPQVMSSEDISFPPDDSIHVQERLEMLNATYNDLESLYNSIRYDTTALSAQILGGAAIIIGIVALIRSRRPSVK